MPDLDAQFAQSELERRLGEVERKLNQLDQAGLDRLRESGVLPFGNSLEMSRNGMVMRQFPGQYTYENLVAEYVGAPPAGNEDMDLNGDGNMDILDLSFAATRFPPPGSGLLWIARNASEPTPRAEWWPDTQGYLYGLATDVPNGNLTNATLMKMGVQTPNESAYVRVHASEHLTDEPVADVVIKGSIRTPHVSMAQITSDQNDYDVGAGTVSAVKVSSDAARNITGIVAPRPYTISLAPDVSYQAWLFLINEGSFNITLKDASGSSAAANRFALDADVVLKPKQGCLLFYDTSANIGFGWRAIASPSSAGGSVATDAIWDAKGDLAVGTALNTAQVLSVGADGTVLTADSAQTTGIKWAAAAAGSFSYGKAITTSQGQNLP